MSLLEVIHHLFAIIGYITVAFVAYIWFSSKLGQAESYRKAKKDAQQIERKHNRSSNS